jgi:hypothetical protein
MLSGGFTEAIMHFVGYLKMFDDIARDRIEYNGAPTGPQVDESAAKHPNYQMKVDIDDLDSTRMLPPAAIADSLLRFPHPHPLVPNSSHPDWPDDFGHGLRLPKLPAAGGGGGGGGGGEGVVHQIKVAYDTDSGQSLIDIHQTNVMWNNDVVGLGADGNPAIASQIAAIDANAFTVIQQLADNANAHIPEEWWTPQSGSGAVELVKSHDQSAADGGASQDDFPTEHSVSPGRYVDGVLQDTTDPADTDTANSAIPERAEPPDFGNQLGQWADLGGNYSLNAALIVDLGEAGRTMVVKGDYFHTDAIFQTNTLVARDHIVMDGQPALPATDAGDDNADVTTNIADFSQLPGLHADVPAYFAGPQWQVTVVDGDYYDIRVITQINYLSDNDVVAQWSDATHYEIQAGGNGLENLAALIDGSEIKYDLIIVAGAYHGMNIIFQNNILLTDNEIRMITGDGDATQTATTGGNTLVNQATIENYGATEAQPSTDGLNSVIEAVENGETTLDPQYGTYFDASGGVIHVLYVTGDYYDVNAIWQTNVTSDINVMAQLVGVPPEELAGSLGQDGSASQNVIVGNNVLANEAAIVDAGPTNLYVDGDYYSDAVLVQADLVADNQSIQVDSQALVPELVAFVTDNQESAESAPPPAVCGPVTHDDPIASITH